MSKLTDKELENLFRDHLLDLEKVPSPESWSSLSKAVEKKNFLTIGWKHFNIYQLSFLVIGLFSILIILFYSNSSKTTGISRVKKSLRGNIKTIPENIRQYSVIENNKKTNTQTKNASENPTRSTIQALPIESKTDSTNSIEMPVTIEPKQIEQKPEEIKIKKKRIITLIQRDTVIVKDTVSVKIKKRKN